MLAVYHARPFQVYLSSEPISAFLGGHTETTSRLWHPTSPESQLLSGPQLGSLRNPFQDFDLPRVNPSPLRAPSVICSLFIIPEKQTLRMQLASQPD
jgi:hypothetical protein